MNRKFLLTACLSAFTSAAMAQSLPDWSGSWRTAGSAAVLGSEGGKMFVKGTVDNAPLKPEWAARYKQDQVKALNQGKPNLPSDQILTDTNTLNCFAGMPRLLATPFDYSFINTPGKTFIIADKEVRQIFTDGRDWPPSDAQWPLFLGRSKGHWEGDTLVAETIDMRDDLWTDTTPLMLSSQAKVTERIRKTDATTLEDQITIHDPVKFTQDWHFVRHYTKQKADGTDWPDDPELCGGPTDRNPIVNGKVTVELPGEK